MKHDVLWNVDIDRIQDYVQYTDISEGTGRFMGKQRSTGYNQLMDETGDRRKGRHDEKFQFRGQGSSQNRELVVDEAESN